VATRVIAAIEAHMNQRLTFPHSGSSRENLAPGLRVTVHRPYVIYYVVSPREVTIVRVLHGARDLDAIADKGGFSTDWPGVQED